MNKREHKKVENQNLTSTNRLPNIMAHVTEDDHLYV